MGQPGKGVFVKATPAQVASEQQDAKALSEPVAALKHEVADLRERVGRMDARLATVAGKPRGGNRDQAKAAAGGGR